MYVTDHYILVSVVYSSIYSDAVLLIIIISTDPYNISKKLQVLTYFNTCTFTSQRPATFWTPYFRIVYIFTISFCNDIHGRTECY